LEHGRRGARRVHTRRRPQRPAGDAPAQHQQPLPAVRICRRDRDPRAAAERPDRTSRDVPAPMDPAHARGACVAKALDGSVVRDRAQVGVYARRLWPPFALAVLLTVTWALVDSYGGITYEGYGVRMFLNLIVVLALQIFSGNSGVVSFGHAAFVATGAYFSALLTIPPEMKTFQFLTMPHWLSSWVFPADLSSVEAILAGAGLATLVAALFAPAI